MSVFKKKVAALLGGVLLGSLLLVGCGGSYEDDYEDETYIEESADEVMDEETEEEASVFEGTSWELVAMVDENDVELKGEELEAALGIIIFEFQSEGLLSMTKGDEIEEGTWSEDGNTALIVTEETSVEAIIEDNAMTVMNDGILMVFQQQ